MASKLNKLSLRSQAAKELSKSKLKTKSIDYDYDVIEEEPNKLKPSYYEGQPTNHTKG